MSEKQVGFAIFKLAIFSGILAVITAFMMGVSEGWNLRIFVGAMWV